MKTIKLFILILVVVPLVFLAAVFALPFFQMCCMLGEGQALHKVAEAAGYKLKDWAKSFIEEG